MITFFITATTSGWAQIMYLGASARRIDWTPQQFQNLYWCLFFVLFVIIGAFFMMNLFVGVIIATFQRVKRMYGRNFLLT
mmetsp:Transcript_26260/g.19717  ORF Transcript_26260/g.19717 Transcript_26260/m.19717 type:complete len:80 (+) Transcript_26260:1-240(+)